MSVSSTSKIRVLINSASGAITLLINVFFVFWLYQYLLARIPADEFAIYPVLMVIMMLGPVIISFFASAISREIIVAYSDGRHDDVTVFHTSIVLALAGFLSLFALVGFVVATQIDHLLTVPDTMLVEARLMTMMIVLELCVGLFASPFSTAFEVRQRFMQRDVVTLSVNIGKIILTGALLFGLGPNVVWVSVASLTASVVNATVIIIMARRMLPEFRIHPARFSLNKVRSVLSFGAWTSLGTVTMLIYQSAGPVLLNIYSTPVQVTSFFIGSVFDRRISSLMTVALAPIQPVMVAMNASGDWTRLGNTYLRGGRYALWVAMAVATPIFIYADDFITLYIGDEYQDASTVTRLFLAGFPVGYADVLLSRMAVATGRIKGFFLGTFVAGALALITSILVLTYTDLGAVGVAGSILVTAMIVHLGYFWPLGLSMANTTFSEFLRKVILRGCAPAVAGSVVWLPTQLMGLSETWLGLFLWGFIGGFVYVGVLLGFCLSPDERRSMKGTFDKLRGRAEKAP